MAVLFALLAAGSFGIGDFLGGFASKRTTVARVVAGSHVIGLAGVLAVAPFMSDTISARDLALGSVGGLFGLVGLAMLYRGLARGPMAVVSPITGIVSAVVPVVWGMSRGEHLSALAIVGVAIGFVAIALMSSERAGTRSSVTTTVVVEAVIAGAGFGVFFVFIAETADASAPWPLVSARFTTAAMAVAYVCVRHVERSPRGTLAPIVGTGLFDAAANVTFLLASNRGLLSVVSVITSLYPAGTILLARVVLSERLRPVQNVGLLLAVASVVLVGAG